PVLRAGLLTTDVDAAADGVSANAMVAALWESPYATHLVTDAVHRIATLPFDHTRRAMSALFDDGGDRMLVVKGAPEQVMAYCTTPPAQQCVAQRTLDALFADGRRVVAVASKAAPDLTTITTDDECGLTLNGFLVFADEPKAAARDSLAQ